MHRVSFAFGVFYILLSATGLALVGLFGKLGSSKLPLQALMFWRFAGAFFIALLVLWLSGKLRHSIRCKNLKMHLMRAFFVLGAQYSFYYYIHHESLLNGLTLLGLGPLSIPLIEKVFMGRKIGKSTAIGLVISFAGALCILQPDGGIFSGLSLVGLMAGLLQGGSQVVFGMTAKKEGAETSVLYLFFLCALFGALPYLFTEPSLVASSSWSLSLLFMILVLCFVSVLSQVTRAFAYKCGTPSRLSMFLYFSIILGGVFDWAIFHEPPNGLSIFGAILVITGGMAKIYLRQIFLRKP